MDNRWRAFIERFLPWYEPSVERQRDAKTDRIARKAEVARLRAERVTRVIEGYETAEKAVHRAGADLMDEVRRDDH